MAGIVLLLGLWTGLAAAFDDVWRAGGFLVQPLHKDEFLVSTRTVGIVNPGEPTIFQATPRAQATWRFLGLDVEQPLIWAWAPDWTNNRHVGNLRTGLWLLHDMARSQQGLGFELTRSWPYRDGKHGSREGYAENTPAYWGSQSRETLDEYYGSMWGVIWQATWFPDRPLTVRAGFGTQILDLAVVKVLPLSDSFALVVEQDYVLDDWTHATLRPLARLRVMDVMDVDMGVQIPYKEWSENRGPASLQMVVQARGRL